MTSATTAKTIEPQRESLKVPAQAAQTPGLAPNLGAGVGVPRFLQRRALTISPTDDPYEREAEQVAEQVTPDGVPVKASAPGATPVRPQRCVCGGLAGANGECAACRQKRLTIQRKTEVGGGAMKAPASVLPTGGGQPLPLALRVHFEPRFGHDFAGVRLHTDAQAAASARAVQARAFTAGRDIVFGTNQYAPETLAGQRLLAHELTHVVQQAGQRGEPLVQRDTETSTSSGAGGVPLVNSTAREWVERHGAQLVGEVITQLENSPLTLPLTEMRWRAGQGAFIRALLTLYAGDGGIAWLMLPSFLAPDSLTDAVNIGRDCYPAPLGSALWKPGVVAEVARRLSLRLVESLERVAPRLARHQARGWTPVVRANAPVLTLSSSPAPVGAPPATTPSSLPDFSGTSPFMPPDPLSTAAGVAFTHPIDPYVYSALRTNTDLDAPAYRMAHPDQFTAEALVADEQPLRTVRFTFLASQGLPSWLRVTEPRDARVEEVAKTLYGDPAAAYRLTAAPPLFGLPAQDIPRPIGRLQTPDVITIAPNGRIIREGPGDAHRDLLFTHQLALLDAMHQAGIDPSTVAGGAGSEQEILRSPLADQAALQAAARILPTPGVNKALIQERLALIHNNLADMEPPAGELARPPVAPTRFDPYLPPESRAIRERVDATRQRVYQRFTALRDATEANAILWDGQSRGQLEIVSTALNGIRIAAGLAAEYRGWPHIYELLRDIAEAYVAAAEVSDLYPTARARLDVAERRSVLFPATALELWLAQIRTVLAEARTSEMTSVQVDPGTSYGVNDMDRQEQELRNRLATVRSELLQNPRAAQATLRAIFADVQSLQTGASLALNLDTVDRVWQALFNSLSLMGEVRALWGGGNAIIIRCLHAANRLNSDWSAILREWRYGDRQVARQRLQEKANDPEWRTWVSDMAQVIKDQESWDRLMTFAAMVGIAILSGGIGAYVEAAAGAAWGVGAGASAWVELGAAGVGVLTEATVFTAMSYPITARDPSLGDFAGQFGQNLLFFAGGRALARGFQGLLGETRAATVGGRLATTGVVGAGFTGVNLLMANAQAQRQRGRGLSGQESAEIGLENVAFIGATTLATALLRRPLANLRLEGELAGLNLRHTRSLQTLDATLREINLMPEPNQTLRRRLIGDTQRAVESEQVLNSRIGEIVAQADALVDPQRPESQQARDRRLARFGISAELAGQLRSGAVQSQVLAGVRAMQGVRISQTLEPVGADFTIRDSLYQEALNYFRSLPDTQVIEPSGTGLELLMDPNLSLAPRIEAGGASFLVQPQGEAPFRVYRRAAAAVGDVAGRVELAPSAEAAAAARDPMARPSQPGGGRAGASEIDWGLPSDAIEGVRQALIRPGRGDVGGVARSMQDAGVPVGREQIEAVKRYLFDSRGIQFDRANYEAWQRLAAGRGQVRDIAFLVHELAEIRALEAIRRQTGFDYRGGDFERMSARAREQWQADFNRYYLQAHSEALAVEYRYVADAVAQATNGRARIGRNIAAAIDPTRGEARANMQVDGHPLAQHPEFATWQARASEVVEIGIGAQERLRLPTRTPTLAELVAAVKRGTGGPEAAGRGVSLLVPTVGGRDPRRGRTGAEANDPRVDPFLDTLDPQMAQRFRQSGHAAALRSAPNVVDFLTRTGELNVRPFEQFIVRSQFTPAEAIPILNDLLAAHPTLTSAQLEAWTTAMRGDWAKADSDVSSPVQRLRAAVLLARQPRYASNPVQAVTDLRAMLRDNVELPVALNELTRASDFGNPTTAPVAGRSGRGPDLRFSFAGRSETVGREMYATDLNTPASATQTEAQAHLGDDLMRGIRRKARDYQRSDVPAFTQREVAVQVRRSSGGYDFDPLLTQSFLDGVMQRIRVNPDTVSAGAQDVLSRVVFYDSRGNLVYLWNR